MATRESMDALRQEVDNTVRYAEEQYKQSSLQQQYNNDDYTQALQKLEATYQDIAKIAHSASAEQRDQLHRMRLQIQQMQNNMILQDTRGGEQF